MSSKNYFEKVANQWDQMRENFFSEAVREKAFSIAEIQPGTLVADIGAGTGFITEGLLRMGAKIIAIDQSMTMLEELDRKFNHNSNITCLIGESAHLPLPDDTVDYVFANMYLHHTHSPSDAIKEMVRIIKPGGKLIITDLDEHNFQFLKCEHHDHWMGFSRDAIRSWFDLAQLNKVQIDCSDQNCYATSCDGNQNAIITIFVASGIKVTPL